MERLYFIIPTNDTNLQDILNCVVEKELKPISLAIDLGVCKIENGEEIPECLVGVDSFTETEILEIINGDGWFKDLGI